MNKVIVFKDFLGTIKNEEILDDALKSLDLFYERGQSSGFPPQKGHRFTGKWNPAAVFDAVRYNFPKACTRSGVDIFNIKNIECEMSAHFNDGFLSSHNDVFCSPQRKVSFVYYFNRQPKQFTGGDLIIHKPFGAESVVINPDNDTCVFFDSRLYHEVSMVSCLERGFGRFTVTGWIS